MAIIEPKSSAKNSGWSIMFTPPRAGREELPVAAHLEDVGVAGERPEARPLAEPRHLGLLVERDRALAAERRERALALGAARPSRIRDRRGGCRRVTSSWTPPTTVFANEPPQVKAEQFHDHPPDAERRRRRIVPPRRKAPPSARRRASVVTRVDRRPPAFVIDGARPWQAAVADPTKPRPFSSRSSACWPPYCTRRRPARSASTTSPRSRRRRRSSRTAATSRPPPAELAGAHLRSVPRHPLSPRPRALARGGPAVRGDVLPPRQVPDRAGAHQRGHRPRACATSPTTAPISTTARTRCRPRRWGDLGFAGFRAHYPLNGARVQGRARRLPRRAATFARSARACATASRRAGSRSIPSAGRARSSRASPSSGSSGRPRTRRTLTVYALLDSPRASGAYQFDVHPGDETVMDVRARLFLRAPVATLGIAPLTSMFFFGENQPHRTDFRPEVHDSDGLMVATGDGEWLWRPLLNPKRDADDVVLDARAARVRPHAARPRASRATRTARRATSCGRAPGSSRSASWGPGRVELVQLHTPDETNDNIVAYWVPERAAGRSASRSTSPTACTGRGRSDAAIRPARGSRRRAPAAATPSSRTTSSSSSSTSPARRSPRCRPTRR